MTLDKSIDKIKRNNVNNQVIISVDVNVSSVSWYSRTTDERGDMIKEFIVANNLVVLNRASKFTTYAFPLGTSNIDVILTTPGIAGNVFVTGAFRQISNHNVILFKILSYKTRRT